MGAIYFVAAAVLGGDLPPRRGATWRETTARCGARRLFRFSLLYLALMCAAMVIDRIIVA